MVLELSGIFSVQSHVGAISRTSDLYHTFTTPLTLLLMLGASARRLISDLSVSIPCSNGTIHRFRTRGWHITHGSWRGLLDMHEHGSNHLHLQTTQFCIYWEYQSAVHAAQDSLQPLLVENFIDRRIGNIFSYTWLELIFFSLQIGKTLDALPGDWYAPPIHLQRHQSF